MTLLNTSLRRKSPLFLVAAMLSLPSFAADFNQTQRLANQGDARAQYDLGVMYGEDKGVRQNYNTAKEWFGKACDNGYQKGCDFYRSFKEAGF